MCDKDHYDDLINQVEKLEVSLEALRKTDRQMLGEIASLRQDANASIKHFIGDMEEIKEAVYAHKDSSDQIISAWETATGLVAFVKALAKLVAAITTIAGAWYAFTHWGGK